jgi:ubiquinone/menaquinone biosynthesis C-methylase UbiE
MAPHPRVADFYDRHPISLEQVLSALGERGKGAGSLDAEDLFPWDQDHYGGLEAVAALARRADVRPGSLVLDLCSGLGGPARFLAGRLGARLVGLELHRGRVSGAARLTRLVRLDRVVRFTRGDAQSLPFRAGVFAAVVSQEALLHVPDKARTLGECARVLVPGGRLAFTDWVARPKLGDGERQRLEEWMAAVTLQSVEGYRALMGRAGFAAIESEDLSDVWITILRDRLAMYRGLRKHTVARLGQARYDEYNQLYEFFVDLIVAGKLGGARFSGRADRGVVSGPGPRGFEPTSA